MAIFEGQGDMTEIVEVWDRLLEAFQNQTTVQNTSISGIASIGLRPGSWEFDFGGG